jgi:hypothetical protein
MVPEHALLPTAVDIERVRRHWKACWLAAACWRTLPHVGICASCQAAGTPLMDATRHMAQGVLCAPTAVHCCSYRGSCGASCVLIAAVHNNNNNIIITHGKAPEKP